MSRYYKLSDYFIATYQEKYVKLSLDGGFTCPNRDGTLDTRGCIFCAQDGSGAFAGCVNSAKSDFVSILEQLDSQKKLLSSKWKSVKYIAYFQNYTNTYADLKTLERLYSEPFQDPDVEGLVVSTRPDCLPEDVVELLSYYNQSKKIFWVELGLQSIHEKSALWMRRHYTLDVFEDAYNKLKEKGIKTVIHLIVGLPGETKDSFLQTIKFVSELKPFGVKLQMLNVLKETDLEKQFSDERFELLSQEAYIEWVVEALENLDPSITIHRLTGDGAHEELVAPLWIKDKRSVLNGIEKSLKQRNSVQGLML